MPPLNVQEFQTERSDLLDTIRQLTRQVKLKEVIIGNFVPEEVGLLLLSINPSINQPSSFLSSHE